VDLVTVLWAIGPRWKWLVLVPIVAGPAVWGLAQLFPDEYVASSAVIIATHPTDEQKARLSVQAIPLLSPEDLAALDPMPAVTPALCRLVAGLPTTLSLVQHRVWPDGKGAWSVAELNGKLQARASPAGLQLTARADRGELAARLVQAWAQALAEQVRQIQAEALRSIIRSLGQETATLAGELSAAGRGSERPGEQAPAATTAAASPAEGGGIWQRRRSASDVVRAAKELTYVALNCRLALAKLRLASVDGLVRPAGPVPHPGRPVGPNRRLLALAGAVCAFFGTLAVLIVQASLRVRPPQLRPPGPPTSPGEQR